MRLSVVMSYAKLVLHHCFTYGKPIVLRKTLSIWIF